MLDTVARAQPIDGVRVLTVRDSPAISRTLVWRSDERSELVGAFVAAVRQRAGQPGESSRGSRSVER